ncbi:DEAD/DEAH box helicase [Geothrix fuzhouensis]|uniref:DEAD/DEAH box helicase n=1 Tax=Geothrix fuzhouensis TaxID=2966451 RepID=UPI0021492B09|nr:DEAD/DEAH box helicase family protein [Geothrix fuzhouensis]
MNKTLNALVGRMSLRAPQAESLKILAQVADLLPMTKDQDAIASLDAIKALFPTVEDFERDFPSLCFALATGVGKTRLMGAFIAYLYQAKGIRHFFVLAPNLTIYNKLITDFTPGTSKYVFQGISDFTFNHPEIITGDNYESGRGVRVEDRPEGMQVQALPGMDSIHINIFNISKINSEVRGGKAPRIKRLAEYIGQSYFDYLAGLPDLVLLMDEAHRYRAAAGMKAINELKPIMGLELTATPFVEGSAGSRTPFKNVIYDYSLANAMKDGFVKEPAVATRENFNPANYTEKQLEKLKLEDGVRIHEFTKVELTTYAKQNGVPYVKPFMLVVAQDVAHANELVAIIQNDDFFDGRYKSRVITVHSNLRGEESEDVVAKLLAVEDPLEPTEIVVHVNMLKEGWDVRNLYTIVPLRAANSRTLVEQSIGRGLRLPYGKRTGVPEVDTLTIVAHDRFQDIVDHAKDPDSIIRKGLVIGKDIPDKPQQVVTVPSVLEASLLGTLVEATDGGQHTLLLPTAEEPMFKTEAEKNVVRSVLTSLPNFEHLRGAYELKKEDVRAEIVREAEIAYAARPVVEGEVKPDIAAIVEQTLAHVVKETISIPRIIVVPTGEVSSGFSDFDLDTTGVRLQPVDRNILLEEIRTNERRFLQAGLAFGHEERLEDYLVRELIDRDDISYDDHAALLYKLAGQLVKHLQSYLADDGEVENVLQYHQKQLGDFIHAQMQAQVWEKATGYEARVTKGFVVLKANVFQAPTDEPLRDFKTPVSNKQDIPKMLFNGFKRCMYPIQKFDSDSERRFAEILENEREALKWMKPASGQFRIFYNKDHAYEPDFVVETESMKLICEPKMAKEMKDEIVLAKKAAADLWCQHATKHELENGGKPWKYVLIPHDQILPNSSLVFLLKTCATEVPLGVTSK